MSIDHLREEAQREGYLFDFTPYLENNPTYLTLEDKTARFIYNTMDQMVNGRDLHLDRPTHYPFTYLNKEYAFYGDVEMRDDPGKRGTGVI